MTITWNGKVKPGLPDHFSIKNGDFLKHNGNSHPDSNIKFWTFSKVTSQARS